MGSFKKLFIEKNLDHVLEKIVDYLSPEEVGRMPLICKGMRRKMQENPRLNRRIKACRAMKIASLFSASKFMSPKWILDCVRNKPVLKRTETEEAFIFASKFGELETIKKLYNNIYIYYLWDKRAMFWAVTLAAQHGQEKVVKYLVDEKQYSVDFKTFYILQDGNNATGAVKEKKRRIMEFLIERGADVQ